jgi:hypothetical protein
VGAKWKRTWGFCFRNSPTRGLVSREVVEDDVDLLPGRTQGGDFLQESDEVLAGVASRGRSVNPAGGSFQSRIEGERPMPVIFETVPLGAAGRKRQNRIEPVERLNGGLFVDAEEGRMLGRVQIQADDVCGLAFEVRIVAGHVALQAMRLQTSLFPDAMHSVLADTRLDSQIAAAPVRRSILRLPAGGGENPRPQLRSEHRGWLSGVAGIQPVEAGSKEPLLPASLPGPSSPPSHGQWVSRTVFMSSIEASCDGYP